MASSQTATVPKQEPKPAETTSRPAPRPVAKPFTIKVHCSIPT